MNTVLSMMATGSFLAGNVADGSVQDLIAGCVDADMEGVEGDAGKMERLRQRFDDPGTVLRRLRTHGYVWCLEWHRSGFPRIVLGHKHAAALMATRTRHESIPDARAPWRAFLLDVPAGLLDGTDREVAHVQVTCTPDMVAILPTSRDFAPVTLIEHATLAMLGDFDDLMHPSFTLLSRLVLGVCMEMTTTTYKGGVVGPRPAKKDPRTGEPRTWTFQLTRDVKVDCRDAVRAYSRGQTHTSPTVQTLVRGHWKQQTCGKGGADRKNIFVEPYWRGPEDAHIALRKHAVRHPDDAATDATT